MEKYTRNKQLNHLTFTEFEEKDYVIVKEAIQLLEEKGYSVSEKELIGLGRKTRRIIKEKDIELYNLSQKQFQTNKYNCKQNNLILHIVAIIIYNFCINNIL